MGHPKELLVTDGKSPDAASSGKAKKSNPNDPQWADGLRQLYDSVVDEPLPDSFKDLLSKLDGEAK